MFSVSQNSDLCPIWHVICCQRVFSELRKVTTSFPSFLPHGTARLRKDGFSWNLYIWAFFDNLSRKFKFRWNLTRITGTVHEELCTFYDNIAVLLRIIHVNVWDRSRGNQNTHFMFKNPFSENRAVYELVWNNIVELDMPQVTIRRMRVACWVPAVTHCEYVTLLPLQQWLHERSHCYFIRALRVLF